MHLSEHERRTGISQRVSKCCAEADCIISFAGYEFTFPFLSEKCGVTVEDNVVKPLYKHLINVAHPTMAFIGIPSKIVPFPFFDYQVC